MVKTNMGTVAVDSPGDAGGVIVLPAAPLVGPFEDVVCGMIHPNWGATALSEIGRIPAKVALWY